eukprot:g1460.t1
MANVGGLPTSVPVADVVTLEQVPSLPYDTIVLGVGGAYMKGKNDGEFMKACPYSASVEMAMIDMGISYKLIRTHLLALEKEAWFINLHPKGKPSTPMLWSHGRWVFDTLPILDELMKRFPERNHEAVHVLKENCNARGTLRSGPLTKFAGSVNGSAEESTHRASVENALRPFVDTLSRSNYLGGNSISFSDCHFSQQVASAAGLIWYLKQVDIIGERPALKAYYDRLAVHPAYKNSRGPNSIRNTKEGIRELEQDYSEQCAHWCVKKWNLNFANLKHPVPDVVTLEQVRGLPYDTIVLGVGGAYMKGSGEFMKACPYSASVEMAMCDMQIPYKLIQTHLLALEKEPWFVALHPKGKPSTPMLWSHGRWIFDTLPILDELMRRYPERQHHAVHVLKENCDARGTLRSGPMTKFAGSVDGSAEESQQRVALENALRPFVDRLTQGKYLGGDTLIGA